MAVPVSLADAKRQLRIEDSDNSRDTEINGFIADATAWVERYTGHILVARDVVEEFDGFSRLALTAWPIKPNATLMVSYADISGAVAISSPRLALGKRGATVWPALSTRWPVVAAATRVTVTVRAGYEAGDAVPGNLRRAMLLLIGAYDRDREGGDVLAAADKSARAICASFRARPL